MKQTHIAVKDWKKHQHYHDPRPPWIKLYGALLDDAAFLSLPDAAQLQLVKLWLLASRMGHPLPNDARLLAGKIGCRGKFHLDALLSSGFLVYENPREILEKSDANLTPVSTEVREQSTENRTTTVIQPAKPWQPIRETGLAERLASDAGRNALAALLQRFGDKAGIVGECEACMDGMRGEQHKADPAQMDMALSDYAAKYGQQEKWEPRLFRGCVRSAMRPVRINPVRRGGPGQSVYDKIQEAI